jgi:hypothetical protein
MTDQTNELSDYDLKLAADERRRAQVWIAEEKQAEVKQREADQWARVSKMSPTEFESFKAIQIRKSETAAKAAKEAAQPATKTAKTAKQG